MAGYLLKDEGYSSSIVYCQLSSNASGDAMIILYTNHHCASMLDTFAVTKEMFLRSGDSLKSSIFQVDTHRFCARTLSEQKLWVRALFNVKLKLMHGAFKPSEDELAGMRSSVWEQVKLLRIPDVTRQPMLPLKYRSPFLLLSQSDRDEVDLLCSTRFICCFQESR